MASAVIGGTVSEVTGGKFANRAVSAAFTTAAQAAFSGDFESYSYEKGEKNVAFIGGALDDSTKVLKSRYEAFKDANEDYNVEYFEWNDTAAIKEFVGVNDGNVDVVAHSFGADTAINLIADGLKVNKLYTLDPVGYSRRDLSLVKANTKSWINVNSVGSKGHLVNDMARVFGRAYRNAPAGYANYHITSRDHDHVSLLKSFKW